MRLCVCQVIIGILSEMSEQSSLVSLLGPLPDQARIMHETRKSVSEMETQDAPVSIILCTVTTH